MDQHFLLPDAVTAFVGQSWCKNKGIVSEGAQFEGLKLQNAQGAFTSLESLDVVGEAVTISAYASLLPIESNH